MDKYYSYTDFLRAVGQSEKVNEAEKLLNEIYLDLFLNRIQRTYREEQLTVLIDQALDERDENAFHQYASELEMLHRAASE